MLEDGMDESPENLVFAQLQEIRTDLANVRSALGEIRGRLGNLENGHASIIQHLGQLAASGALQQAAFDRVTDRLGRLERRLELRDA